MIKNFRLNIIFRVVLLLLLIILLVFVFNIHYLIVSKGIIVLIIILQVFELIRYVERTNKQLSNIFESIQYSDFTRSFTSKELGSSFESLGNSLNQIVESFRKNREENEQTLRYLDTIVQHVGTGLLVFNQKGEVETINSAAKRILEILFLKNINDLNNPVLKQAFISGIAGENILIQNNDKGEDKKLALSFSEFRRKGHEYKIVSIKDIRSELEGKEFESWQNITRVLIHEIVNSITPISSLSATSKYILQNDNQVKSETLNDLTEALTVIEKRSEGVIRFVETYRNFAKIPSPVFQIISVKSMISDVINLYKGEFLEKNIEINFEVEPASLEVTADRELIELVLINLTKNAIQALQEKQNGKIEYFGKIDLQNHIIIQVRDNGSGIINEALDKIFVPFYSTKQGGSGIGLSLSKRIMYLHKGSIRVESIANESTTFTLRF